MPSEPSPSLGPATKKPGAGQGRKARAEPTISRSCHPSGNRSLSCLILQEPRRSPMKSKASAAAAKDNDEPVKIRSSSRSKRRHTRRSSTESESPTRKHSKKPSKRTADKKSKRSKVRSSSHRRRCSPSPSPSLSSSSPSSLSRSCSTCSSSSDSDSERSVSPPSRSRSRDVKKKRKGRGRDRDRERDLRRRRKARRSTSSSSSGSSRSRSKSSKRSIKDGTTRNKMIKDYEKVTDRFDHDEEVRVAAKKGHYEIERYEKNVSLEKIESPPSKSANEAEDILPAGGGSPVATDLELILRQKALDNFRKFRAAAAMAGKTDNRATGKETLADSPQNAGTKVAEARSAAISAFAWQASSLGVRHPTESPKSEDHGNGKSPRMQKSSAGISHGAESPSGIRKNGDTGDPTRQEGSAIEATYSTSRPRSPQDGRHSRSVMQRLVNTPGSASSVNKRLGSIAGVSHVNGAPRIKSVVSIPSREGRDGSTTPQGPYEKSTPVESEIRQTPTDISKAEGTNGDDRMTSEASASNASILLSAEGKRQVTEARIEDKDGSQFQKKTFSRMHDGETVEVSYKVYIPKKTPALARRNLQR